MPSIMLERRLSVSQGAARNVQKWPRLCQKSGKTRTLIKIKGYPFSSTTPYILYFGPSTIWSKVNGSVTIACSSRRKKSRPREREVRRLKRKVNSSR